MIVPPEAPRTTALKQPSRSDQGRTGIALCLSGGGYRAALFHVGALRRMHELGILSKVTTVSSVSGGSIVAAHLVEHVRSWDARDGVDEALDEIRRVTKKNIRTSPVLQRLLPWNWLRSDTQVEALARQYSKLITRRPLTSLPEQPRFVLCATDMAYGVNWTFARDTVGDYQVGYADTPSRFSLARAVAASSCFPPILGPLRPRLDPAVLRGGKAELGEERDQAVRNLGLSDGGVYDNMGLEPVWKDHEVVLVSDGGATFDFGADKGVLWRLQRYNEIISRQASGMRKRWLISSFIRGEMSGAYWGIGSDTESYGDTGGYPEDLVRAVIAQVRTDLDAFSDAERAVLENHGYVLADVALRRHVPDLIDHEGPTSIPHPQWMDPNEVADALRDSHRTKLPFGRR